MTLSSNFSENRSDFSKDFVDVKLDTIEKSRIINISINSSESYAFLHLQNFDVTFLDIEENPFDNFSIGYCL